MTPTTTPMLPTDLIATILAYLPHQTLLTLLHHFPLHHHIITTNLLTTPVSYPYQPSLRLPPTPSPHMIRTSSITSLQTVPKTENNQPQLQSNRKFDNQSNLYCPILWQAFSISPNPSPSLDPKDPIMYGNLQVQGPRLG